MTGAGDGGCGPARTADAREKPAIFSSALPERREPSWQPRIRLSSKPRFCVFMEFTENYIPTWSDFKYISS